MHINIYQITSFIDFTNFTQTFGIVLFLTFITLLLLIPIFKIVIKFIATIIKFYKIHEFDTSSTGNLPQPPTIKEKYSYIKRKNRFMIFFSLISFSAIQISLFNFILTNQVLWPLLFYFFLTIIYFLDSFFVNFFSKDYDLAYHKAIVEKWRGKHTETVDIFLPVAGEPIEVLENTWKGVKELTYNFPSKITVYCLDDSHSSKVKALAKRFGFEYAARPDKGWYKKAGNLRHGFKISRGTYIAIFDADFRPRSDFLHELLPYFYENFRVGLVQSPQYFDVHDKQNWLERGAGAVQELFYRVSQVSRQGHNASICVGSNALYRRAALDAIGGTALVEHSEDVHTGFNIRRAGWTIQYVPILLAKGLCPADMKAFFKQQYRWCLGSMSLLMSGKFWRIKISFLGRLSYFSGFMYYIHTAISSFFVPIIPIALIVLYPHQVNWQNYLLILPSIIYVQLIYPLWHNATYGIEAWSTRTVYGWAHLFAIRDTLTKNTMKWQPTGAKLGKDLRYIQFRVLQIIFNFVPAIIWVYLAAEQVIIKQNIIFLPLLVGGIYYYMMTAKVTFYISPNSSAFAGIKIPVLWRKIVPMTSFAACNLVLLWGVSTYQLDLSMVRNYMQTETHTAAQPAKKSKAVLGKTNTKKQLENGYYIAVIANGDTFTSASQRIIDTYSAEYSDIVTLKERRLIRTMISQDHQLQIQPGAELHVTRKAMKQYLAESRTN